MFQEVVRNHNKKVIIIKDSRVLMGFESYRINFDHFVFSFQLCPPDFCRYEKEEDAQCPPPTPSHAEGRHGNQPRITTPRRFWKGQSPFLEGALAPKQPVGFAAPASACAASASNGPHGQRPLLRQS